MKISIIAILHILVTLLYIYLARKYKIVDRPSHRGAHTEVTLRGLGVIFLFSGLFFFSINGFKNPLAWFGFALIGIISFIDDIKSLSNRLRILFQFLSVGLLLSDLVFHTPIFNILWVIPLLLIIGVGILNAFNFMDGINGITGVYSLITICSICFLNNQEMMLFKNELFEFFGIALIIFLFLNFRRKAVGFAGDVGAISLAYVVIYLIFTIILKLGEWKYIMLLSIYGIDTIYTILYRISIGENIFKAHKLHFFQILVHEFRLNHLLVALLYGFLQLTINLTIIFSSTALIPMGVTLFYLLVFHVVRKHKSLAIGS